MELGGVNEGGWASCGWVEDSGRLVGGCDKGGGESGGETLRTWDKEGGAGGAIAPGIESGGDGVWGGDKDLGSSRVPRLMVLLRTAEEGSMGKVTLWDEWIREESGSGTRGMAKVADGLERSSEMVV